jgi:tetratricopeptide (TPR) repeat protein
VALLLVALAFAGALSAPTDIESALREAQRLVAAGDRESASEMYLWALERSAPGSPERARTLEALALHETNVGQYASAMRHAREAVESYAALNDPRGQATSLNRVGRAAAYAGDYKQAVSAFQSAVKLSRVSGDREALAEQLGNVGSVFLLLSRYSEASRAFDDALRVVEEAATEKWASRRRHIVRNNQATLLWRLGRNEDALMLYKELAANRDLAPQEHAQLLVNLGVLYRRVGDPIKALTINDEAQKLFARDRNVEGELSAMKTRGIILAFDLMQFEEAERSFSAVVAAATRVGHRHHLLDGHLFRGETLSLAGHADKARVDLLKALALARELRTPEEEWQALYALGRNERERQPGVAREYLTQAVSVIERVRENIGVPSMRFEFFNDKREVYDALIALRLGDASSEEIFDLVERRHSRGWRERLRLSTSVDLPSVQAALPADALLLDYWTSSEASVLVAISRTRAAVIPVTVDDAAVKALVEGLASGPAAEWRRHAQAIGAGVLPPADWFDGLEHVVVVADGPLALVPFELLATGDRLLIQRAAVSYTPTAATLLRPGGPIDTWSPPWQVQLRAFADPVFASASLDDLPSLRTRLAASALEVREIDGELGGAAALYLGADNRKAHLEESRDPVPILHIATHAIADTNAMEQSRMAFSPPPDSGSGADYLFLGEVYNLPLDAVELAVLSACDTERGPEVRGEGVQSFSRAFLAAGARSTVTTLWRIPDRSTVDFMKVFYHHLQRGIPRDQALRRAKLRFLDSDSTLAHPHFWATFVLTGDALRPIPRALTWNAVILAGALLALTLAAGAWMLRRRQALRRMSPMYEP